MLGPALIQTFLTILAGYLLARFKIVPTEAAKYIGQYVTLIALPCNLLYNIATIDLSTIDYTFLGGMTIAKSLVFLVTILLTMIQGAFRYEVIANGAIFAIFTTQSNDFALGAPILTALFSTTHPTYPQLLYIIAPISLVLINPICFFIMETANMKRAQQEAAKQAEQDAQVEITPTAEPGATVGSAPVLCPIALRSDIESPSELEQKSDESDSPSGAYSRYVPPSHPTPSPGAPSTDSSTPVAVTPAPGPKKVKSHSIAWKVTQKVLFNPVVVCTVLGVAANFAFHSTMPASLDPLLKSIGNSFSSTALFTLGIGMVGKLGILKNKTEVVVPVLLIIGKTIFCAIVCRMTISLLGANDDLVLCAFLVGCLPTAPSVPFFALEFNTRYDLIAPSMVIGTFVSAPVIFISAQLVNLDLNVEAISDMLINAAEIIGAFGIFGSVVLFTLFMIHRSYRSIRDRLLICLMCTQFIYAVSSEFCSIEWQDLTDVQVHVRYAFVFTSALASRIFMTIIAVNELVRRFRPHYERRCFKFYLLVGILLPLACTLLLETAGERWDGNPSDQFYQCYFLFGTAQFVVIIVVLFICAMTVLGALLKMKKKILSYYPHPQQQSVCPKVLAQMNGTAEVCPNTLANMNQSNVCPKAMAQMNQASVCPKVLARLPRHDTMVDSNIADLKERMLSAHSMDGIHQARIDSDSEDHEWMKNHIFEADPTHNPHGAVPLQRSHTAHAKFEAANKQQHHSVDVNAIAAEGRYAFPRSCSTTSEVLASLEEQTIVFRMQMLLLAGLFSMLIGISISIWG